MIYASAISDGVHNLMTMESSPAAARAQQVTHEAGRRAEAPRVGAREPEEPAATVRRARDRDVSRSRGSPRRAICRWLLPTVADAALQEQLKAAADAARRAIDEYAAELESKVLPQATGEYAIGTANVEARYRAEELIDTPGAGAAGDRRARADRRRRPISRRPRLVWIPQARPIGGRRLARRAGRSPEAGRAGRGGAEDRRRAVRVHPRAPSRRICRTANASSSPRRRRTILAWRRCIRRRRSSRTRSRATTTSPTRRPTGRPSARTRGCRSSTTRRWRTFPRTRSRPDTTCTASSCGGRRGRSGGSGSA